MAIVRPFAGAVRTQSIRRRAGSGEAVREGRILPSPPAPLPEGEGRFPGSGERGAGTVLLLSCSKLPAPSSPLPPYKAAASLTVRSAGNRPGAVSRADASDGPLTLFGLLALRSPLPAPCAGACGGPSASIGFRLVWVVGPAGFSGINGIADSCGGASRGSWRSSFRRGLEGGTAGDAGGTPAPPDAGGTPAPPDELSGTIRSSFPAGAVRSPFPTGAVRSPAGTVRSPFPTGTASSA